MSSLVNNIEFFVTEEKEVPNVTMVTLKPLEGTHVEIAEGVDEPFEPFAEGVEKYAGYMPMVMDEETFFFAGTELFARVTDQDPLELVIFISDEIKGFMPAPIQEIAKFVDEHKNSENAVEPTRAELNEFYRLQNVDTEKIENPVFQKFLDAGDLGDGNVNELMDDTIFLIPTKIGKKNIKKGRMDFFLLNAPTDPDNYYLPIFTDWQHLGAWYFSAAGANFKGTKDSEIAAIPSNLLMDMKTSLDSAIAAFVVNPVTNDFILNVEDSSEEEN
jgi:hypothetical protein